MPAITIDLERNPELHFRIDGFSVPPAARAEFEETMRRNTAFIARLPGFLGHTVFEKEGGPTVLDVVTVAVWESHEAFLAAAREVRDYYARIGFDGPAAMARWGVEAQIGNYRAPRRLQEPAGS